MKKIFIFLLSAAIALVACTKLEDTAADSYIDNQIAFNAKYFVDCLKNIDDDFIKLSMTTNRSPCVVKPVDNDKKLYLILPVKM